MTALGTAIEMAAHSVDVRAVLDGVEHTQVGAT